MESAIRQQRLASGTVGELFDALEILKAISYARDYHSEALMLTEAAQLFAEKVLAVVDVPHEQVA